MFGISCAEAATNSLRRLLMLMMLGIRIGERHRCHCPRQLHQESLIRM
jgi:hypothetical protein